MEDLNFIKKLLKKECRKKDASSIMNQLTLFLLNMLESQKYYDMFKDYLTYYYETDSCQAEINILPLLASALAEKEFLQKDIEELYETNSELFALASSQSAFKNSYFFKMETVTHLKTYVQIIGILETIFPKRKEVPSMDKCLQVAKIICEQSNEQNNGFDFAVTIASTLTQKTPNDIDKKLIFQKFFEILKKGYKGIKRYFNHLKNGCSASEINFFEIIAAENVKNKNLEVSGVMSMAYNAAVSTIWMLKMEIQNFHEMHHYDAWVSSFVCMMDAKPADITVTEYQKQSQDLLNLLNKDKFVDMAKTAIIDTSDDFLFFLENLDRGKIYQEAEITEKDMKDVAATYIISKEMSTLQEETDPKNRIQYSHNKYSFVSSAITVKALLKVYKKSKKRYEALMNDDILKLRNAVNSKENELSQMKDKISQLEREQNEKNKLYEKQILSLKSACSDQETENIRLKKQISETNMKSTESKKELAALRSYIYKNSMSESEEDSTDISIEEMKKQLCDLKIIIIGGHPNFHNKMKQVFGTWKYIAPEVSMLKTNMLKDYDLILLFDTYAKHSLYKSIIQAVEQYSIPLGYIGNTVNIERSIRNIYSIAGENKLL